MKIGFIGLGKLGLECAEVMAQKHQVVGYDIRPRTSNSVCVVSTIEDCVKDIKSWQIQNALFLVTDDQYFELLEKVFCKDKDYVKRLKEIIK
jgi:UDP-N-acetyl-D-mannosaminuronate dehydrogenase